MQFIPRVIIFGDSKLLQHDFPTQFEIIGQLEIRDSKCFIDGKEIDELKNFPFDYILCTDRNLYKMNKKFFSTLEIPFGKFVTQNQFRYYSSNVGFTAHDLTLQLIEIIKRSIKSGTILDIDGYFLRAEMIDYPKSFESSGIKIEGIVQNCEPIFHNVYSEMFSSLDKVKLRHYDLVLITAERSIDEWNEFFNWATKISEVIIAFVHQDSSILQILKQNLRSNFKVNWQPSIRGEFLKLTFNRKKSAQIFVSTHDKFCIPKLPLGYRLIHAGKKISSKDFGIPGDDTGENVSELNLQINELSVLYWTWKNFQIDYIGFASYRRYFAISDSSTSNQSEDFIAIGKDSEHIMTIYEGIKLLKDCDILVGIPTTNFTSFEYDYRNFNRPEFRDNIYIQGLKIYRRWFEKMQPDYVETLNRVDASPKLITNTIFFTRWSLFKKYCEWLFSFLIPAAREFEKFIPNAKAYEINTRTMSYKGEQAFMVWLMRNNLRIKFLPILLNRTDMHEDFGAENFIRLDRIMV